MLKSLRVKDFALIDDIELEFAGGLNVLTGETGAGKSLIIDCLSLIAGGRADATNVKRGREAAAVEAAFDITSNNRVREAVEAIQIEPDSDGILVMFREVSKSGKSRARVNGTLVSAGEMALVAESLIDIFGQHEGTALTKPVTQLSAIDSFLKAEAAELPRSVDSAFMEWKSAAQELQRLEGMAADRQSRLDFLEYQLKEILDAAVVPGEEAGLVAEAKVLANSGRLYEALSVAFASLYDTGTEAKSAADMVIAAMDAIGTCEKLGLEVSPALTPLGAVSESIAEASEAIRKLRDSLDVDSGRASEVEDRLALIGRLKRKLRVEADELEALGERCKSEIEQLRELEVRTDTARRALSEARSVMLSEMNRLSEARREAARELSEKVEEQLKGLMMPRARFVAAVVDRTKADGEDAGEGIFIAASGRDKADFRFSANLGEEPMPIAKIASGGELSRFMLAFKVAGLKRTHEGAVMVFDEIDQGVGGAAANFVAAKLRQACEDGQALAVTHLAQIAAAADAHILISKEEAKGSSIVSAQTLDGARRQAEIARMLSGDVGKEALEHASIMIRSWENTIEKREAQENAATNADGGTLSLFEGAE